MSGWAQVGHSLLGLSSLSMLKQYFVMLGAIYAVTNKLSMLTVVIPNAVMLSK